MSISIITLTSILYIVLHNASAKYSVSDLKVASDPWNTVKLYPRIKNVDNTIAIKGIATLLEDFGNDNWYAILIWRINPTTNVERQMISQSGGRACDNMSIYVGFILREVETIAGVPNPGSCPIAKGNYTIKEWYKLNLNKIPLFTMVPNAIYRLNITVFGNDRKTVYTSVDLKFTKQ